MMEGFIPLTLLLKMKERKERQLMKYAAILLVGLLALTMGCGRPYTVGKHLDQAKVGQITPGTTTAGQVESLLGKPEKVEPTAGGQKYIYYYYQEKPAPWYRLTDVEQQRLEVTMAGGVVQRVNIVQQGINKP